MEKNSEVSTLKAPNLSHLAILHCECDFTFNQSNTSRRFWDFNLATFSSYILEKYVIGIHEFFLKCLLFSEAILEPEIDKNGHDYSQQKIPFTMWKFQDFSIIQILCEINF